MNIISAINWVQVINSPWVIGIGTGLIATVVGGIIVAHVLRRLSDNQANLNQKIEIRSEIREARDVSSMSQQSVGDGDKKSRGSAGYELVKQMDNQSPYLRETAEDAYIGQPIELEVRYINIHKVDKKDDLFRIVLVSNEGYPWVYGTVTLSNYPWLKTLKSETIIRVGGEISSLRGHEISLKNLKLYPTSSVN